MVLRPLVGPASTLSVGYEVVGLKSIVAGNRRLP